MTAFVLASASTKGGPGSGDKPGHPFRGNQWTGGGGSYNDLRNRVTGYNDNREHAVLVDREGDILAETSGEEEDVPFPKSPLLHDPEAGLVQHHNHPYDTPPSLADVMVLTSFPGLYEVNAHSDRASYRIRRITDDLDTLNQAARREYNSRYSSAIRELRGDRSEQREREVFSRVANDALESLASAGLISYEVILQKSSRLAIAKHLLSVASQAVQLKRMLLKDQLRQAVVKAVHVRQWEEAEREIQEAASDLIKRQFADAGRKLGRTKSGVELIEKGDLPGHPFRGNQWTGGTGRFTITYRSEQAKSELIRMFGRDLSDAEIASMVAAPPGTEVYVRLKEQGDIGIRYVTNDIEVHCIVKKDPDGKLVMYNDGIDVQPGKQGKGIGTKFVKDQVDNCAELGFDRIELYALGNKNYYGVNGYYTWPRLGFDAELPSKFLEFASAVVPGATRLSDLMKSPEGRSWWKENGDSLKVQLNLDKNSLGRKVLNEYAAERAARQNSKSTGSGRWGRRNFGQDLGQDRTATKSPSAQDIFNPRDWDQELVDSLLPVLMKKAGEAAAAQMLIMGVDVVPKRRRGTKRRDGVHRGPISTPNYHRIWQQIREGKRRCQRCGAGADTVLIVHHVDSDGSNDDRGNLQVLCDACHRAMPDGPHTHPADKGKKIGEKGDLPGHPFRGNQWTGGGGESVDLSPNENGEVITSMGRPIRFYMGTESSIGEEAASGKTEFWLTSKQEVAQIYGSKQEVAYVRMKNPFELKDVVHDDELADWVEVARARGNDGLIARRVRDNGIEHITAVVFGPNQLQVDTVSKSPSFISTKASRATEWLLALEDEGEDLSPLWPEVFSLPGGGTVDLGFATEWPDWMKAEISKQMKETFEQPFWAGINDTTASGIQSHVLKGLEEGLSIREIQQMMVGDGLDEYYRNRGQNIARTEAGNALNGARSAAMDRLAEEVPGLKTKKTWMSVLGTTTRDSHAALDGVPADRDGEWFLGGVKIPWPSHWRLPPSDRCQCQCTIVQSWGMPDSEAEQLIEDYNRRLAEERAARDFWTKHLAGRHDQSSHGRGGSVLQNHVSEMISHLETIFKGPGRAAAVNEVLSAAKFPEYLKGILQEVPGADEIRAVVEWSVRRGRMWEAA